jgi:competence protein ComEC
LTAAVGLSLSVAWGLLAALVLAALGLAAALTAARDTRRLRARVVAAALLCAGGAAAAASWRVAAVHRGPLPRLARAHASVTLVLVVTSDPHLSAASPQSASTRKLVVLSARAVRVTSARGTVAINSPVVVLTTAPGWLVLQPTQRVTAEGRVTSPQPGEMEAALFDARGPPTHVGAASVVERMAGRVRTGLRLAAAPLPAGPRGLLPGLVDGDTSQLPSDVAAAFRTTGLTHIVAVSGANVAIMLGAALALARCAGTGLRAQAWIGALTIIGFVVVARPQASVLRAAAMGLVVVLALATGRRRRALPALCAAVLCLMYIDPTLSLSIGFALSVLATAALLVLAPLLRDRMSTWLPRWLAEALATPTAATLVCAPLIALISGRISLSSIPANLLAEPAVAPATVLGVATACVAPFSMGLAHVVARVAGIPCWWLVFVARTLSQLPGASLAWPSGVVGAAELTFVLGGCAVALRLVRSARGSFRRSARGSFRLSAARSAFRLAGLSAFRLAALAGIAAGACAVVAERSPPRWPQPDWVFAACDVGQGEAIVVRTAVHSAVLVDAGAAPPAADRCLLALGVRELSLIVLTGGGPGAIGGLPGALHARAVDAVDVAPGGASDGNVRVRGWSAVAHVGVTSALVDQAHLLGELRWRVVADAGAARVVAVALPGLSALVTGDIGPATQAELATAARELATDVLVVPRHGDDNQDLAFLDAVRPRIAVVSVGRGNSQHQPSARVLKALAAVGSRTMRTDRDGDVAISVEGGGLRVVTRHGSHTVAGRAAAGALVATSGRGMTARRACAAWDAAHRVCRLQHPRRYVQDPGGRHARRR